MAGEIATLPINRRSGTIAFARAGTLAPTFLALSQNLRTRLFYCLPPQVPICHNLHHTTMAETNVTVPVSESPGKWIARVAAAVVFAEAVWGFVVSVTNNLVLPALARGMGGDPQSPLYLGKGEFNVPAIFSSILQLCLGGIAAALLYQWSRSAPRVRVKTAKVSAVAQKGGMPSILPATTMPSAAAAPVSTPVIAPQAVPPPAPAPPPAPVATSPVLPEAAPTPTPPPAVAPAPRPPAAPSPQPAPAAKPQKAKKPAEVYYNIVGEPINPTEDD